MVDDQTIRIGKQLGAKNGTSFRLDPDVKVLIQTEEDIDLGLKKPSPKNALGKLADVKLGQRVTVAYTADVRLIEIVILRPKAKK